MELLQGLTMKKKIEEKLIETLGFNKPKWGWSLEMKAIRKAFNQELEKREKEWFKNIKPSGKGDYYTISATRVKKLKGGI